MTKKNDVTGTSTLCQIGEVAIIRYASTGNTVFGAELLTRAIANHERGLPGRIA